MSGVRYNRGVKAPRGPQITEAVFKAWWADQNMTVTEMARRLGISMQAVRCRAAARGYPPRGRGRPYQRTLDWDRIVALYAAGLSMREVAKLTGTKRGGVAHVLEKKGVKTRPKAFPSPLTIADLPRVALERAAREEQAALRLAEMVDPPSRVWRAA